MNQTEESQASFILKKIGIIGFLMIIWQAIVIFFYHRRHRANFEQFHMLQMNLMVDMMLMTCAGVTLELNYITDLMNGFTCILGKTSIINPRLDDKLQIQCL